MRPEGIVLLTFTRIAAEEMTSRAEALVGHKMQGVRSGTFHGFSLNMLQKYKARLGLLSGFSVLNASDAEGIIAQKRRMLGLNGREVEFPSAGRLATLFSRSANTGVSLQLLCEQWQHSRHTDGILAVWEEYEAEKRRSNYLDFDDLLVRCHLLFEKDEVVRQLEAGACEHLLVDEYQDTSPVQDSIVKHLSSVNGNVMVVGDDAQSIYGFRGASVENIRKFEDSCHSKMILADNYRSTQQILDLANALLSRSTEHFRSVPACSERRRHENMQPQRATERK